MLEDVRNETDAAPATANGSSDTKKVNGKGENGNTSTAAAGTIDSKNLAVPQSVIDEALRVTRESLEAVCEVEENGSI